MARSNEPLGPSRRIVIRDLTVWLVTGLAFAAFASAILGAAVGLEEGVRREGIVWASYGGAITYLGAFFTYLYFAFPLIALSAGFWAFLVYRVPAIERSSTAMIGGLLIMSAIIAVVIRMVSPEPPIWYTMAVLSAFFILPRMTIRRIRPGSFFSSRERDSRVG